MKGQEHPTLRDIPIGIDATGQRHETDSMGGIDVPADRYWGAQTQRSLVHFAIGDDRMPKRVYHAYGYVKKAAALVNAAAGRLAQWKADAIVRAADEAIAGKLDAHFPLYVWQTGSGTQSNMNVNEVLSNRIQLLGGKIGSKSPVHPNDDVNMGQSSNDTFPTAMHIAAVLELEERLLPHAKALAIAIEAKANEWNDVVKIGRTHLQDAVPLTVGQEWSGWAHQIRDALRRIRAFEVGLFELAAGGTAVGTGLNAPTHFSREIAEKIAELTGYPFVTAHNKFAAQGVLDAMVAAMAAVRGLAVALMSQRHALARLRTALRLERTSLAGERARLVDHAGQGQPDAAGSDGDGLHPGDRRRQRGRVRRQPGEFRAQRDAPDHHQQLPSLCPYPRRCLREAATFLGRGDAAQPSAHRRDARPFADAGDRAQPDDRV
jgi:fumarate hydratase, class II